MINVLRQINVLLGQGVFTYASEIKTPAWKGIDIPDKYKLVVSPGDIDGGFYSIAGSTTHTIALPENYVNTARLFCLISAFGQVRVAVVNPALGTSTFTLNGTTTVEAVASWNGRVSSMTITTPSATAVKVRYSLFMMPDLNDADSFRGGVYNFGELT